MFFDDFFSIRIPKDIDEFITFEYPLFDYLKKSQKLKPNNTAPKSIEGQYDLTIKDKNIVLSNKSNGVEVEVMCHPDDAFDISVGMKVAFDRYKEQLIQRENAKNPKQAKVRRKLYVGNLVMIKKNTWVFDEDQYAKVPQDIVGYITRMYTVGNDTLCEIQSTDKKYEFIAKAKDVELIEQ